MICHWQWFLKIGILTTSCRWVNDSLPSTSINIDWKFWHETYKWTSECYKEWLFIRKGISILRAYGTDDGCNEQLESEIVAKIFDFHPALVYEYKRSYDQDLQVVRISVCKRFNENLCEYQHEKETLTCFGLGPYPCLLPSLLRYEYSSGSSLFNSELSDFTILRNKEVALYNTNIQ
jgi:hypothetical protein